MARNDNEAPKTGMVRGPRREQDLVFKRFQDLKTPLEAAAKNVLVSRARRYEKRYRDPIGIICKIFRDAVRDGDGYHVWELGQAYSGAWLRDDALKDKMEALRAFADMHNKKCKASEWISAFMPRTWAVGEAKSWHSMERPEEAAKRLLIAFDRRMGKSDCMFAKAKVAEVGLLTEEEADQVITEARERAKAKQEAAKEAPLAAPAKAPERNGAPLKAGLGEIVKARKNAGNEKPAKKPRKALSPKEAEALADDDYRRGKKAEVAELDKD